MARKVWYGSATNRILENVQSPTPTVGMGATVCAWSDRYAATVIEVRSPSRVVIQYDTAIRTDDNGMSESQSYRYEPNPKGMTKIVTRRRDGAWRIEKEGTGVRFGKREAYHDYSF
ncbi:MAG: hypothetical protein IPH13_20060 [Planctomycetes bacterium]|nr:hypothetical protein [Planctomycetota bacterium]